MPSHKTSYPEFILTLIHSYVGRVRSVVATLKCELGCDDLLRGAKRRMFPPQGEVTGGERRLRFHFHGIGCRVQGDQFELDFDFVPSGAIGFDGWRLYDYWENSLKQEMPLGTSAREEIDDAMSRALSEGLIVQVNETPGSHLFVLNEEAEVSGVDDQ